MARVDGDAIGRFAHTKQVVDIGLRYPVDPTRQGVETPVVYEDKPSRAYNPEHFGCDSPLHILVGDVTEAELLDDEIEFRVVRECVSHVCRVGVDKVHPGRRSRAVTSRSSIKLTPVRLLGRKPASRSGRSPSP